MGAPHRTRKGGAPFVSETVPVLGSDVVNGGERE